MDDDEPELDSDGVPVLKAEENEYKHMLSVLHQDSETAKPVPNATMFDDFDDEELLQIVRNHEEQEAKFVETARAASPSTISTLTHQTNSVNFNPPMANSHVSENDNKQSMFEVTVNSSLKDSSVDSFQHESASKSLHNNKIISQTSCHENISQEESPQSVHSHSHLSVVTPISNPNDEPQQVFNLSDDEHLFDEFATEFEGSNPPTFQEKSSHKDIFSKGSNPTIQNIQSVEEKKPLAFSLSNAKEFSDKKNDITEPKNVINTDKDTAATGSRNSFQQEIIKPGIKSDKNRSSNPSMNISHDSAQQSTKDTALNFVDQNSLHDIDDSIVLEDISEYENLENEINEESNLPHDQNHIEQKDSSPIKKLSAPQKANESPIEGICLFYFFSLHKCIYPFLLLDLMILNEWKEV